MSPRRSALSRLRQDIQQTDVLGGSHDHSLQTGTSSLIKCWFPSFKLRFLRQNMTPSNILYRISSTKVNFKMTIYVQVFNEYFFTHFFRCNTSKKCITMVFSLFCRRNNIVPFGFSCLSQHWIFTTFVTRETLFQKKYYK